MHLVRLGPDEPRLHPVDRPVEFLRRADPEIVKPPAQLAIQVFREAPAAPDLVFADPALAFMHPHRHASSHRRQLVIGRDVQLVPRMPNLVDRRIDAVERLAFDHPRRDPAVIGRPRTERMHGQINPPMGEIITKRRRQIPRQRQLRRLGEPPFHPLWHRFTQHRLAQGHQPWPHPPEHRRQSFRRRPRLIIVDQRVIQIAALCQTFRLLPPERYHLCQRRQEIRHTLTRPCRSPNPLRCRGHPRQFLRQIRWHPGRPDVAAPDQTDLRLPRCILRVRLLQPIPHPSIAASGVQDPLHRRQFLAALLRRPARHHGFLIPAQPFRHQRQRLGLPLIGHQIRK